MLSVKFTKKDHGFKTMLKEMHRGLEVEVGYFSKRFFDDEGIDIATKAWQNEYGTVNIPERPFIRSTIDENKEKILFQVRRQIHRVYLGRITHDVAVETLALYVIGLIKKKMARAREWAVANAPSTIEEKGSDLPLTDSGQLKNTIDWREVK